MKVKQSCWNCGKAVKVPAGNSNIYTRICTECEKAVRSTSPHRKTWTR